MIARDALTAYLDVYLACGRITDYAPNGLQIEGRAEIKRLCSAVSISQAVIQQAVDWHADAIIVHHGFFWRGEPSILTGVKRQRIGALIAHDLNLFAYHLPLDVHPIVGNNACIATRLDVREIMQHDLATLPKGLWAGTLGRPMSGTELSTNLKTVFLQPPLHIAVTLPMIKKVAWCSGAAQDFIVDAQKIGADAYISGELSERTFDLAKELNIHYFGCGHHATERYGVQALGAHLADHFNLEHQFIDSDNPI